MQQKELNFVLQQRTGFKYIYPHGYIPTWKDLEFYPCGLKQKDLYKAKSKAYNKLREYNCKPNHQTYRIIKRYIELNQEELQLKISFQQFIS